jgi:D-alanyl-D-alanine carboxypeptidase/D-alanyl-D-alanine-endopeptidase (penicillin-binding protein 4)
MRGGIVPRGILVGVVGIGLASCGGGGHSSSASSSASGTNVAEHAPQSRPKPKPKPRVPPPSPQLDQLRSELEAALGAAGSDTGGAVFQLTGHYPLFALRADVKRPPASVEKIYTTVAVLQKLGPNATLETDVLGAGHLDHGVWHGDLYLRGGGDPTFGDSGFNDTWNQGQGPTATQLVQQLQAKGIKSVTGQVIGDAALFDEARGGPNTAYRADPNDMGGELAALTYDHGTIGPGLTPGAFAANELAGTMRASGIQVTASKRTLPAPGNARLLASVSSPSMATLLKLMDVPSDDFFAEMLAKQLGVRFGGAGTTRAGAKVIFSVISGYGVHPDIVDGSGLSRRDLTSPNELVKLLDGVWRQPVGDVLWASLPIVGKTGTTTTIATGTPAQGNCIAKTGTLNFVTNLAGYCHSQGHKTVAFALFIDGPPNSTALVDLSRMVADIAKY